MKRKNLLMIVFMLIGIASYSQTCTIQTLSNVSPGPVQASVTMTGFSLLVSSFQMSIIYDTNVLHYVNITDWFSGVSGVGIMHNYYGNFDHLTFVWGDYEQAISGVLCHLNFNYKGPGCSDLTLSSVPTTLMVADGTPGYNTYTVNWVSGQICGIPTGIENNNTNSSIEIYPTVATEKVTIKYNVPENGKITFGLYNMIGDEIQTITRECNSNTEAIQEISVSTLNSGLYFIKYQIETASNNIIKTEKITVTR
jgi:hypothetical protein